jgi:hypothetical protein
MGGETSLALSRSPARIGQAAQEEQAAGAGVADQEDKGMVGPENGRWRRQSRKSSVKAI